MIAVAYIKYIRISPKKIRELVHVLVGLSPKEAIDKLAILTDKRAKIVANVVKSALSNATNNLKLNESDLRIKTIEIFKGPFHKRWQPVSRGMAHQIKKQTSHIKVVLTEISQKEKRIEEGQNTKQDRDIIQKLTNKKNKKTRKEDNGTKS